jgi:hypothetical protein
VRPAWFVAAAATGMTSGPLPAATRARAGNGPEAPPVGITQCGRGIRHTGGSRMSAPRGSNGMRSRDELGRPMKF